MDNIDWSVHDKYSEQTCICAECDTEYQSHAKFVLNPTPHTVSRKPCPHCGSNEPRSVLGDWEVD